MTGHAKRQPCRRRGCVDVAYRSTCAGWVGCWCGNLRRCLAVAAKGEERCRYHGGRGHTKEERRELALAASARSRGLKYRTPQERAERIIKRLEAAIATQEAKLAERKARLARLRGRA